MDAFLQAQKAKNTKKDIGLSRTSVSAEAFGIYNKKKAYVPKVIAKNPDQKARIRAKLDEAFMFKMLEDKEKMIVINAMEEKKFAPGDTVIKEGDDGDVLFLVETGELECTKVIQGVKTHLLNYTPGMAFGELALLYNAPRAATIVAKQDSICWSLDRECFNGIVKESSVKRRERFEEFIKNFELLQELDPYERTKICDVLQAKTFSDGEYVIKQVNNDHFYNIFPILSHSGLFFWVYSSSL